MSLSRNALLALVGLTLVLHDAEEYLTFPGFFASPGRLSGCLSTLAFQHNTHELRLALVAATVLPLCFVIAAVLTQRRWLLVAVLFLKSVLLVNALGHTIAALINGGYVPGLITALLINLPFGVYLLRRAVRESWVPPAAVWQMIAVAIVVHVVWLSSGLWAVTQTTRG